MIGVLVLWVTVEEYAIVLDARVVLGDGMFGLGCFVQTYYRIYSNYEDPMILCNDLYLDKS